MYGNGDNSDDLYSQLMEAAAIEQTIGSAEKTDGKAAPSTVKSLPCKPQYETAQST